MTTMGTQERRHFFERICELRVRYATLGRDDREAVMDIDEAVALMAAALAAETEVIAPAGSRSDYLN